MIPIWGNTIGTGINQENLENKVTSVNDMTGDVKLDAKSVGALSQDELQSGVNLALETARTSGYFDGNDGRGITKAEINAKGELIITYTDNTTANVGKVVGAKGDKYEPTEADLQAIADKVKLPDTYSKDQIDTIMGSYITDIDTLIGGVS